jgi:hypothetical protein
VKGFIVFLKSGRLTEWNFLNGRPLFFKAVAPSLNPLPRRGISALRALNGKIYFFQAVAPPLLSPPTEGNFRSSRFEWKTSLFLKSSPHPFVPSHGGEFPHIPTLNERIYFLLSGRFTEGNFRSPRFEWKTSLFPKSSPHPFYPLPRRGISALHALNGKIQFFQAAAIRRGIFFPVFFI